MNRLSQATSPYLLQHQHNPVHWQPWDQAALDQAQQENKPILLSVGYAACHWCHVMAHESFENEEIAQQMNQLFICIKVDREERPDLDTIFQNALAMLGEQGGWPLTMFLTPKGEPFWGGTYFPPAPRYGRPGFPQLLQGLAEIYEKAPEKVAENVTALTEALQGLSAAQGGSDFTLAQGLDLAERMARSFDPFEGGFSGAPKFPNVPALKLLWRAWHRSDNQPYRDLVLLSLEKMCQGGIYDHLRGGFARYSVDAKWLAPHFEKMLYDNAQLIEILTWAWQETRAPLFATRVHESVAWLLEEMLAAPALSGGPQAFAASLDADSEGEEGLFYVWDAAEVKTLLGDDYPLFAEIYDLTPHGNWEGKTILNRLSSGPLRDEETEAKLEKSRAKLLSARAKRVRPGWDDKVLADWNGLMISALVQAGRAFAQPDWIKAARSAFDFICQTMRNKAMRNKAMRDEEGGDAALYHTWRAGQAAVPAMLDDYANMIHAALQLHGADGDDHTLALAKAWTARVQSDFQDEDGAFFLTAKNTPNLLVRVKSIYDNATPPGNAVMIDNFARLYHLTADDHYRDAADRLVCAFAGDAARNPHGAACYAGANELRLDATTLVLFEGKAKAAAEALLAPALQRSLPNAIFQRVPSTTKLSNGHPAKASTVDQSALVICREQSCSLPLTTCEAVTAALAK